MERTWQWIAGVAGLALAGGGAWLWLRDRAPAPPDATAQPAITDASPPAEPATPAIRYPIDAGTEAPSGAAPPDAEASLAELFGRAAVLSTFRLDGFPRRFVATVDNLGRAHAPADAWPVNPASGRFSVERRGDAEFVGAGNDRRYAPYVALFLNADPQQLVATYRRLYPELQQAYADIGYPDRYFNDRVVAVIDQLLATPEPPGRPAVHLPAMDESVRVERPWVLYQFDDPALQSLSAGQRILLRLDPAEARRIKGRLAELRRLITAGSAQ